MSWSKPEGVVELVAEFTALPGREEEVERLLLALTAEVRNEPGCLEFTPHRVAHAPAGAAVATSSAPVGSRFHVTEAYRDEEAFAAHLAGQYGAEFNAALHPLIVEDRSSLTFLARLG
ncbi:antibiotic biosynthesis monooxygenase [Agromyces sp. ISL-38]|uniref:putative quinol monooxygenase n=1 Tax=Agromyces sp. ISL-38 TaxID=2819107 RepID=UPI001BE826CB|nr:putative quinol monooxygenase [Agromyces sp. ISL-38]MBT2497868.1 antibiotic biosynthesis monooxygenase [Agromyces sp. ISL-38]MBT2517044.1 antibiotic biosynthesis monooxygenase [Streptomyces sp. ISL-90]